MKQYRFPNNTFGYETINIRCHIIMFTHKDISKLVTIDQHSIYRNPVNTDIKALIQQEPNLLLVQHNGIRDTLSYYRFPENTFGFENIGVDTVSDIIYLNHCSGSFISILPSEIRIKII